eukprot:PhF_6_TR40704/c0_g1_i2/m.61195
MAYRSEFCRQLHNDVDNRISELQREWYNTELQFKLATLENRSSSTTCQKENVVEQQRQIKPLQQQQDQATTTSAATTTLHQHILTNQQHQLSQIAFLESQAVKLRERAEQAETNVQKKDIELQKSTALLDITESRLFKMAEENESLRKAAKGYRQKAKLANTNSAELLEQQQKQIESVIKQKKALEKESLELVQRQQSQLEALLKQHKARESEFEQKVDALTKAAQESRHAQDSLAQKKCEMSSMVVKLEGEKRQAEAQVREVMVKLQSAHETLVAMERTLEERSKHFEGTLVRAGEDKLQYQRDYEERIQHICRTHERTVSTLETRIADLESTLNKKAQELDQAEIECRNLKHDLVAVTERKKQVDEEVLRNNTMVQMTMRSLEHDWEKKHDRIVADLQAKIVKLESELAAQLKYGDTLESRWTDFEKRMENTVEDLEQQKQQLKSQLQQCETYTIPSLKSEKESIQRSNEEKNILIKEMQHTHMTTIGALQGEMAMVRDALANVEEDRDQLRTQLSDAMEEQKQLHNVMMRYQHQIEELQRDGAKRTEFVKMLESENMSLRQQNIALKTSSLSQSPSSARPSY